MNNHPAMNPPPYVPPLHPPRPPPPYHFLQPPPPPAPNFIYPFNLHPPGQCETPSSSATAAAAATTTTGAAPASDLPSALSSLTSLLHLTKTTLNSISHLLPRPSNSSTSLVLACPFNPNHLVPASSLFSHYLYCPSSNSPLSAEDLLHSLQYPHTFHSSSGTNPSAQPLENPKSGDLCFSLENFLNSYNNFFYSDCPGPVRVDSCETGDTLYSPPVFTLPGFLYECTCTSGCTDLTGFSVESIRLLPSEVWAVGEEMNGWVDYPASYSYRVLRAILRLRTSSLLCLPKQVIMNSPKYNVIIDLAMTEHIVLLFKLCLKAVIREASESASSLFTGEVEEELCRDKKELDCPVLTSAMRWLGLQLSVLYGGLNGKLFTINVVKECVLDSALSSSVFSVIGKTKDYSELMGVDGLFEKPIGKIEGDESKIVENGKGFHNLTISISQVAAAVAALHERSWLERKIKALRDSSLLTAYQRMVEHECISKRANDERKKRPNYRPLIEHDGLLLQRTQNQEPNRIKTREELLAEERDYKRRRMSYRGKKMKRSTTQVMRDIIDEYMEQIKQASDAAKGAKELESRSSLYDSSSDVVKSEKYQSAFGASRLDSHEAYRHDHRSTDFENKYHGKDKHHRHDSEKRHGLLDNGRSIKRARHDRREYSRSPDQWFSGSERSVKTDRHDRKEYSRSSDQRHSGSHSQGHRTNRGNRGVAELTNEKVPRSSDRSHNMSYGQKSHHRDEKEHKSELRDKSTKKKHEHSRSASSHVEFEDTYIPSESRDAYEDNA